jgi:predicted Holliday junction resolvase-like endonuclease
VREIVFLEVKSGGSTLTARERGVRDAVLARRVSWRELRIAHDSREAPRQGLA